MRVAGVLCGLLLVTSGLNVGTVEKIRMKATPVVSFAPARLTVRTTVEPDADNRAIEIVIDSPAFYRSSWIQLNGNEAPRTSIVEFPDVPRGASDGYRGGRSSY